MEKENLSVAVSLDGVPNPVFYAFKCPCGKYVPRKEGVRIRVIPPSVLVEICQECFEKIEKQSYLTKAI